MDEAVCESTDSVQQETSPVKDNREVFFRRKYDFWPSFYQHSLFSKEDVIAARKGDFESRMIFASRCKQKGDDRFVTGEFSDAINEYERSLSVFFWVEPRSSNWTKEETEDEKLEEFSFVAKNQDDKKLMASLQVSCYLNLAACYQKTKDWANSFEACNYAISIDSNSGRAYFRRAQARIPCGCAGGVGDEELLALCDLKVAHQLAPENQEIARTYVSLNLAIEEHRRKEKELYKRALKKTEEPRKKEDGSESVKRNPKSKGLRMKNGETRKAPLKTVGAGLAAVEQCQCVPLTDMSTLMATASATGAGGSTGGGGGIGGGGSAGTGTGTGTPAVVSTAPIKKISAPPNTLDKPTAAAAKASLKAALLTIEEAISRIKDVEDRAAELTLEGRHAEALILSEKAKTAKLHIESMHIQQAKAEKIQREYFGGGDIADMDNKNSSNADGSNKQLRLRGNLFAVDFLNPSPTIIEDARAQGLDLTDKRARRIMYELQKEAAISKSRALKWIETGTPKENPEGKDDFVARVIDRVYREESRELAGKLVDGLSRGVLLGMLRSRRMTPPVDMGDSSYYALTADAKQLAAVVISGAGAGVLTGLSTYEHALENANQERRLLLARVRGEVDVVSAASGDLGSTSTSISSPPRDVIKDRSAISGTTSLSSTATSISSAVSTSTSLSATSQYNGESVKENTVTDLQDKGSKKDDKKEGEDIAEQEKAKKIAADKQLEQQKEFEKEMDYPLEDMGKDELKEKILPFLAGDLFLIWRETDLATEKEKIRMRNKFLQIEENMDGVSEEVRLERIRVDAMTLDERAEYDKDKREEVVYTMLQDKYGLDEDKITNDAERLGGSSKANMERLRCLQSDSSSPHYGIIMGVITFIALLVTYILFSLSQQPPAAVAADNMSRAMHNSAPHSH